VLEVLRSNRLDRAGQAFVRKLDASITALLAEAVDLEPMPHRGKSMLPPHTFLHAVELIALELVNASATEANEVLVNGAHRETVLIPLEALAEIVLLDQAAADEQVEGPIDGRLPDPLTARTQILLDVIDREVLVGGEHDFRDRFALVRDWKALFA
jgi:hypothetical protein